MGFLTDCDIVMYTLIISLSLIASTSSQRSLTWWRELKSDHDGWPRTSLALDQHLDPASQKPSVKRKLLPHSILSEAGIVTELLSRDYLRALHLRTDTPEDAETVADMVAAEEEEEEVLVLPLSSSQLESNATNQMLEPAKVLGVTRGTAILLPLAGRNATNSITFSTSDLLIHIFRVIASDYNIILLHDDHPETQNVVSRLLNEESRSKLIIVNINDRELADEVWMGHYNDGMDVHILFYSEVETVMTFADGMPHPVWAPDHLLLINAGGGDENATALLKHKAFSHSPYLTLLQEDRRIQSRTTYDILVYEAFRKGNKVIKRGSIGSPNDSTLTFDVLFPDRFESFHGHYFHLSSWVDDFPYMVKGKTLEDTHGMCIYMLDDIAGRLNFTYKVYELPKDHLWGDLHNGSWRGMIGEVWRGEKDFCINVMALVEDRFQAVDFSVPYFLDSSSFVIRNPDAPPRWPSIIFPFSWVTWIAVGMTLLLVPIFFLCLQKLKGAVTFESSSLFMEVTKALLWLDFSPTTSHVSIRIFVGNWWLMAMILSISYTGNLIAFITIPAKAQKMATLQEVAESDLTPVMIDYGNYMPSVMKQSGDKTLMKLGDKLQFLPNNDYQAGFDMVDAGTAAFMEGTEYFRYMVILFKAWNTYFLEQAFFPSYVGWIYPKKTAWKHKFDKYLQRFVEAGLPTYWRNKLAEDFRREINLTRAKSEDASRPLNLLDLQGVFIVYAFCLAISIVVGLVEIVLCR